MCSLKGKGGFTKRPKGVPMSGFVWCVQKPIQKVKVVKYGLNVLNANSGLMKLAHLVKRAKFVTTADLTFFFFFWCNRPILTTFIFVSFHV